MNTYQKKRAQIEKKHLFHLYTVWLHPLSDYGVYELGEAGQYTEYHVYYDDPTETEADRIRNAKDVALRTAAFHVPSIPVEPLPGHGRRNHYRLMMNRTGGIFLPDMEQGKDYDIVVTKQELPESEPVFTFDDIQPVKA